MSALRVRFNNKYKIQFDSTGVGRHGHLVGQLRGTPKMQEWKMQEEIAGVENARGENERATICGKPLMY